MRLPQVIGLASASLLLLIAFLVVVFLLYRSKHREGDPEQGPSSARVAAVPEEPERGRELVKAETRRFGWAEVESLTGNFSSEAVIGEGGFSTVYLARLLDSSFAALKVHRATASERLHRAFRQELDLLRRLSHPYIVRLLGYCDEGEEGVLVFEYMPSGSLHDWLHSGKQVLPWGRRTSIAYKLAQALEYLHEECDPQVVHGDVKAANVLLDGRLDPNLCDFGSACVGFSAAVQPPSRSTRPLMTGSPGYVDPHYLRTGVASKKSDVYSFGVLLLELLTGAEAFCAEREQPLMALLGPTLRTAGEKGAAGELVDPRLVEEYDAAEAAAMASLAARCVGEQPSLRPSMTEVVRIIAEEMSSALIPSVGAKTSAKVELEL